MDLLYFGFGNGMNLPSDDGHVQPIILTFIFIFIKC